VALVVGTEVWAFRLNGSIAQRPAPKAPVMDDDPFTGPVEDGDSVSSTTLQQMNWVNSIRRYIDEYSVSPYRIRVKAGTPVTFGNNGSEPHEFTAMDGSWTTGRLLPDMTVAVTFDKPGSYTYICKDHPWTYGQIIVVEKSAATAGGALSGALADHVARGKEAYAKNCSGCHMSDLSGSEQVEPPPPPLIGAAFIQRWQGRTGGDLFDKIHTTMPTGNPGSLDQGAYLDLTAYILQVNQFPPAKELSEAGLRQVSLSK
jgi:plastocyanin